MRRPRVAVVDSSALLRVLVEGEGREEVLSILEGFDAVVVPAPVAAWVADAMASMGVPEWAAARAVALYCSKPRVAVAGVSGGLSVLKEAAGLGLPLHEAAAVLEARRLGAVLVSYNSRVRRAATTAGVRVRPVPPPAPAAWGTVPPINPRAAAPA